jgi:hypothetical protein
MKGGKGEVRTKQEEEEKLKMLNFRKHEKYNEEALLQTTNCSNRTYDTIDEAFIDEEKVLFPKLTADMQSIIDKALNPRPPNEVIVKAFGLSISGMICIPWQITIG